MTRKLDVKFDYSILESYPDFAKCIIDNYLELSNLVTRDEPFEWEEKCSLGSSFKSKIFDFADRYGFNFCLAYSVKTLVDTEEFIFKEIYFFEGAGGC